MFKRSGQFNLVFFDDGGGDDDDDDDDGDKLYRTYKLSFHFPPTNRGTVTSEVSHITSVCVLASFIFTGTPLHLPKWFQIRKITISIL